MKKAKNIAIYAIIFVLLVAFLFWIQLTKVAATNYIQLGTIKAVENCISSKHQLDCDVVTESHSLSTSVMDWPGDNLQIGDEISNRVDVSGDRQDVWACKNGVCRQQSICWRWMACWS